MKTDHAHVESALAAILLVGILAAIDLFVNMADNHPAKIPLYFGLFFVLYLILKVFIKRQWQ